VTMSLFQDRARLRWLYLVTALGIGYYGFKGGIWVLVTGGGELVLGPDMSFFADNNTLGLALCLVLPILLYLSREEQRPWLKWFLRAVFGFSIIGIIFTYSRGDFLGLAIVLSVIIWRSPWRMRFAAAIVVVALIGAPLAPERLWDRLGSITAQESAETRDNSAAARIEAWQTAWNIALSRPLTGAGFRALDNWDLWFRYFGPVFIGTSDAHSLYFELLEEHGFLGLGLYFGALISALLTLRRLRKRWRKHPEHGYLSHYAEMLQLSFCAFLAAGAFLTVAYFDLYFVLLGSVAVLHELSRVAEAAALPASAAETVPRSAIRVRPTVKVRPTVQVRPTPVPVRSRRRPRHA
jgi:probable O-glycosylation ligase (exosortase A-associated)